MKGSVGRQRLEGWVAKPAAKGKLGRQSSRGGRIAWRRMGKAEQ